MCLCDTVKQRKATGSRASQSDAEQSGAKQGRAKASRAKPNEADQSEAEQSGAEKSRQRGDSRAVQSNWKQSERPTKRDRESERESTPKAGQVR